MLAYRKQIRRKERNVLLDVRCQLLTAEFRFEKI